MPAGRPPIFKTSEKLQKKIDSYFKDSPTAPTITGLVLHCGFCDRQSFYDYEKKPKFSYTIKAARLKIEHGYEKDLRGTNAGGSIIFALKNLGWTDKTVQEVEVKATVGIKSILDEIDGTSKGPEDD